MCLWLSMVILLLRNTSLIPASLLTHYYSQVLVEISFWVFLFKIARSANWVFFLNILKSICYLPYQQFLAYLTIGAATYFL